MARQGTDSCRYEQVEMLIEFLHGSRSQGGCSHSGGGSSWSRTSRYDQVDMLIERLQSSDSENSLPSSDGGSAWSQSTMTVNTADKCVDAPAVYGNGECCEDWYDSWDYMACKCASADPRVSQTSWRPDCLPMNFAPSAHCHWPESCIEDTLEWKLNTPATGPQRWIKDSALPLPQPLHMP